MAAKKSAAKKSTPASRSQTRATSRAKGAARVSASKTSVKQERSAVRRNLEKPPRVQEAGVANLPATIVKAAKTIYDYVGKSGPKPKALPGKTMREASEFQKLMARQNAQTAASKAKQAAPRAKQLAKDSSEAGRSKSSNAFTKREIAESNKAINRQRAINRANATNKATKKK
jgi:hypothetical protein